LLKEDLVPKKRLVECGFFIPLRRDKNLSDVRKLRSLLRKACGVFQQKCIYLSVAGYVEFVEGRRREKK
jgi:hypothetical protein